MNIKNFIEQQFEKIESLHNKKDESVIHLDKMLSVLAQIIDEHNLLDEYYERYIDLKKTIRSL